MLYTKFDKLGCIKNMLKVFMKLIGDIVFKITFTLKD
jgi:hypothetical protein